MLYRFFHRTHGGLFVPVGRAPSGARVSTVGAPLSKLCGKKNVPSACPVENKISLLENMKRDFSKKVFQK